MRRTDCDEHVRRELGLDLHGRVADELVNLVVRRAEVRRVLCRGCHYDSLEGGGGKRGRVG
jgi:hypothetical protein